MHLSTCRPFDSFFLEVWPKKVLNIHNQAVDLNAVSDLDSQDAGLSKTKHVFELQPAVLEP